MSARLKLKKLKKQIEILRTHCAVIKANARYEAARYHALIRKNIVKIEACTELYPADTYLIMFSH